MMKRLLVLLAALLLLAGCASKPDPTTEPSQTTLPSQTTAPPETTVPEEEDPGLYVPESAIEQQTGGAVRMYGMPDGDGIGMMPLGGNLLMFSCSEMGTRITVLAGRNCAVKSQTEVSTFLSDYQVLHVGEDRMAYYDDISLNVVIVSTALTELNRVQVPEDIYGKPALSEDLKTMYYSTGQAICALDIENGISRLLRQQDCMWIEVVDLLFDGKVLLCMVYEENGDVHSYFLSVEDGSLLGEDREAWNVSTVEDTYYLERFDGSPYTEHLFGTWDGPVQMLTPRRDEVVYSLLTINAALGIYYGQSDMEISLYDLQTGKRTAAMTLDSVQSIFDVAADPDRGCIWLMFFDADAERDVLYEWDWTRSPVRDDRCYTGARPTAENPDVQGLALCEDRAEMMGEQYGIEICLGSDILEPWDYSLTPEYRVDAINYGLDDLEAALKDYPEGFLERVVEQTSTGILRIALVRDISGDAIGLQYWIDGDAYIAMEVGYELRQTVYHEISHVLDNFIITNSYYYDDWEELNPEGAEYDYSYDEHANRWDSPWLDSENRVFVDSYSMSYPKEDRARILEYCMMPDNEYLFTSEVMQRKLLQICEGIRDCFGWEKSEETFLWEQYLQTPLAYTKK